MFASQSAPPSFCFRCNCCSVQAPNIAQTLFYQSQPYCILTSHPRLSAHSSFIVSNYVYMYMYICVGVCVHLCGVFVSAHRSWEAWLWAVWLGYWVLTIAVWTLIFEPSLQPVYNVISVQYLTYTSTPSPPLFSAEKSLQLIVDSHHPGVLLEVINVLTAASPYSPITHRIPDKCLMYGCSMNMFPKHMFVWEVGGKRACSSCPSTISFRWTFPSLSCKYRLTTDRSVSGISFLLQVLPVPSPTPLCFDYCSFNNSPYSQKVSARFLFSISWWLLPIVPLSLQTSE